MDFLPYAVTTDTGDTFDIEFPLSAHTEDSVRVHQLVYTNTVFGVSAQRKFDIECITGIRGHCVRQKVHRTLL